jgi:hypothetical protein
VRGIHPRRDDLDGVDWDDGRRLIAGNGCRDRWWCDSGLCHDRCGDAPWRGDGDRSLATAAAAPAGAPRGETGRRRSSSAGHRRRGFRPRDRHHLVPTTVKCWRGIRGGRQPH